VETEAPPHREEHPAEVFLEEMENLQASKTAMRQEEEKSAVDKAQGPREEVMGKEEKVKQDEIPVETVAVPVDPAYLAANPPSAAPDAPPAPPPTWSASTSSSSTTAENRSACAPLYATGNALVNTGKQVGSLATGAAKAVVWGLGKSLSTVQSVFHRGHDEESNAKEMVNLGETVGTQVRHHGFRLSYPDWLDVTIGTVVGCSVCVEPIPHAQREAMVKKEEEPPSGHAAALLKVFVKALRSVEHAASTLRQNNASLNSFDLLIDNVGLGIPNIGVIINLDRR
jgi:hypothetical protein